jgi:multicomponent Na+:H+ antiporter subunit C
MVITGIVVAVSATALALTLMLKLTAETGRAELPDDQRKSR